MALAKAISGEIVGADSMQVYRDLHILTARPTALEEADVPHHLVGCIDGAQPWSVGAWQRAAHTALAQIAARDRPAVIVGGTGLYFRALTDGLADIPDIPAETRLMAQRALDDTGEAAVRERLGITGEAISPGDRQRLVRALEVLLATGRTLTSWQSNKSGAIVSGTWRAVVLEPARDELYRNCDARLTAMIGDGALAEVAALVDRQLAPHLPIMKAVGVRPLAAHLAGDLTLAQALGLAQQDTRRYAKRQLTWLRNQISDWPRLAPASIDVQVENLLRMAR